MILRPRAAEILAEISENVSALKTTLLGSGSPSGVERSRGATTTHFEVKSANVEAQKAECAEQPEGDLNICSDATLAVLWEGEMSGEGAQRGNTALENGAPAARFTDKEDRDDFMSLDITEQELQFLERQAARELVNEAAPEVVQTCYVVIFLSDILFVVDRPQSRMLSLTIFGKKLKYTEKWLMGGTKGWKVVGKIEIALLLRESC